ncbi:MAG: hypothetical protein ACHQAY_18955 [Hyphomicrobiales bacterium]
MAEFCGDGELGYFRSRTQFAPGEGLALDEAYRLAHLPLVAPEHPRVIARRQGTSYEMGRHEPSFSLVLPIPSTALCQSAAYQELEGELKTSPLAHKTAWSILERRRAKLHATICGVLATGEKPPALDAQQRRELAHLGPVQIELRGLFSGNVNLGRLYLRAYPERRDGINMFARIQKVMGRRETDLYLVGIYNLIDDLDAVEASALSSLIKRWWDRPILRFQAQSLWFLSAMDDLVLDSAIVETIPLI